MKNQCIKWAERTDFTEYYLIISQKEMAIKGRRFPNWVEWELNPMGNYEWHFVVHIGRFPECERETIWNVFQEQLERKRNIQYCMELKPSDTCTGAEKHLAGKLEDSRDKEALQWLNLRNATVRDLEQQHVQADRRFNQEQTDAAEQTDAPNQAQPRAVRSKRSSPKKPRKPRTKITDKMLQKAREFLMRNPNAYNKDVCSHIGVDKNCAGFYKDGSPKKLRLVIEQTRQANAKGGRYLITGDRDFQDKKNRYRADNNIDKND